MLPLIETVSRFLYYVFVLILVFWMQRGDTCGRKNLNFWFGKFGKCRNIVGIFLCCPANLMRSVLIIGESGPSLTACLKNKQWRVASKHNSNDCCVIQPNCHRRSSTRDSGHSPLPLKYRLYMIAFLIWFPFFFTKNIASEESTEVALEFKLSIRM